MIGWRLGHYRVLEQLGAGGMGVVYRARDERLERDVAIKVLPEDVLGAEAARKRFRKEAHILSRLNHPNVATIHDFDTHEGTDFLVMELLAGTTLKTRVAAGALPEREVLRLGTQLAAGLAAAHGQGVVHRDLKPGNLCLTEDGRLKILDFGIAQLLHAASDVGTTATALAMAGTLPYMAPEQLRGETADVRSDLYAAGAVLYEMATGERPFGTRSGPLLIDAILHEPALAPGAINRRVSPGLDHIIVKALDKDPDRRYQSARELLVDLERLNSPSVAAAPGGRPVRRRWRAAAVAALITFVMMAIALNVAGVRHRLLPPLAGPARIESLAVLPLANLSGDPEQEYFADGMTDALITDLSKVGALRVISRTSVMGFKNARKPLPEIARALDVDAVIEGSVLRAGGRVRITAQLIHAATDRHLWAENYERDLGDVLALQGEVARAVAAAVGAQLTGQERGRPVPVRPVDPEAYEAYLRARYKARTLGEAASYYKRAIEKGPDYAQAHAGLAWTYTALSRSQMEPHLSARPKILADARAAAAKALELDPALPEPHVSLGQLRLRECEWPAAEREFKQALELGPGEASPHSAYAGYLETVGKPGQALAEAAIAQRIDPLSVSANFALARQLYLTGQYDAAIDRLRRIVEIDSAAASTAHNMMAWAYEAKGMYNQAISEFETAMRIKGDRSTYLAWLGHTYGVAGRRAEALGVLDEIKALVKNERFSQGLVQDMSAVVHEGLGDLDHAVGVLEGILDQPTCDNFHSLRTPWLADPRFHRIRAHPRFQALVRRIGFAP